MDLIVKSSIWWSQEGLLNHALTFRSYTFAGKDIPATIAVWDGGTTNIQQHLQWIRKTCESGRAVVVLDTSPPETLPDAIKMAGFGGAISIAGINLGGKNRVEVDVNYLIFNKLTIKSTFAEPALRFPTAIKLIRDGLMDAKKIISHTFTFEEAEEMIKMSLSREREIIKAVLIPESK